jgi:hypothetical protein
MKWIALKDQVPPIGIEYLGFNPEWIDEDYNPKGIRVWFHDDLGWYSAKYNNTHDCWDTTEEEKPTHWMEYPACEVDQPKEQIQLNYMQVIPATFDDYMKCSKEELITMLLECHRIMGIKGEPIADVQTFTATNYPEQPERRRTAEEILEQKLKEFNITLNETFVRFPQAIIEAMQEYAREGVPSVSDEEIETIVRKHFQKVNSEGMGFLETNIVTCIKELSAKINPL